MLLDYGLYFPVFLAVLCMDRFSNIKSGNIFPIPYWIMPEVSMYEAFEFVSTGMENYKGGSLTSQV